MTNLDVSNSSTDSSSGSSSDSSSSGSSSSSSGSGSSSSDSESSIPHTPAANAAPAAPKSPSKQNSSEDLVTNNKKKEDKSRRASSKPKPSSSSEDDPQIKTEKTEKAESNKTAPLRRRSSAKSKVNCTAVAPKQGKPGPRLPTGGKAKPAPKIAQKAPVKTETRSSLKKKSIFSPDNSSESDTDIKNKTVTKLSPKPAQIVRSKGRTRKSSSEKAKTPATPDKKEEKNHINNHVKRRSGSTSRGPPPKRAVENNKGNVSSLSSSQSSSDLDTHDSDSGQNPKKETTILKTGKSKPSPMAKSGAKPTETAGKGLAPSACLVSMATGAVPRKLTRSLSARVSRMAAATRVHATDTDSDGDDRQNDKSAIIKKGNRKIMRSPVLPPTPPETSGPREKCCPVRGCDSMGHLGGAAPRHFTWDACPRYHNLSAARCVAASEERAAASPARRRAVLAVQQRPRAMPTIEQRAYQLKVKDMRSKWKGAETRDIMPEPTPEELAEEREPSLEGFAPDYDLRLFREAQALAAIKIEEELEDLPSDKGTRYVVMGKYMMEVWYQSPYPGLAARAPRLFVCEFCLAHQQSRAGATRHGVKCMWRHPPGDEVYRKENLSVWQVDGRKHKQYCQQLCLLAKFFLDHKTLYYDVEPFLFYVMTLADDEGCHVVGYFSKEKNSFLNYNVSCILTLPPYQRQGYGRLLIDFSYLLTKVEGKVGSPETPLSDLGLISYRSYWKEALLRRLCSASGPTLCIRDLSKDLAIASCDIVSTLQERGLMKYWKGKHIVLKKQDVLEEMSRRSERARSVEAGCLRWSPPAAPPPR